MSFRLLLFNQEFENIKSFLFSLPGSYTHHYISDNPDQKEYDYPGFENESHAMEMVLNHAAAMANKLEKNPDDIQFRRAVAKDYRNAVRLLSNKTY